MDNRTRETNLAPEIYFLITKFLAISPLEETKRALINELARHKILPKRIDWLGQEHDQTYEELERKYPHIGPKHLLEICGRIGPILDKELPPSVSNLQTLLGAGRQSLLRTHDTIHSYRGLIDYCTRLKSAPLPESIVRKNNCNLTRVIFGREHGGPIVRRQAVNTNFYEKVGLLRRTLGHLSAVYCVLFDRSGKYILTGADDLLVKLWSAVDGRLLATFRGASSEITDIAVNVDNTLLAAGSLDRILRVWDLQTTAPIAVLTSHTGMITSVNFCPSPRGELRYLVTTSTDGSVAFWQYAVLRGKTTFNPKPTQYHEKLRPGQAQMICAAFSPGGIFLAAGSADHYVRVYLMGVEGPKRILETEAHTDTVDSIQWAHQGLRFISGSKDGTAHIWNFDSQQWRSLKLNMTERLPTCPPRTDEDAKKIKVTMVSWDYSDKWVMTAVNDFTIKVWNSKTGQLHRVLRGHTDELYVLESHPKDQHVLLSAGHDGQIFLWDIFTGQTIASFINHIDGQGHGGVFDAKWSPDGTMIAGTDSHGHILMYGFGSGHERLKKLPTELFFHTDYRPLIRDSSHHVLDEQTQTMPHLMPPPFLVDVDGNPHPPMYQRLVPGRENCPTDQLVPNIGVGQEGMMEIQPDHNNTRSEIDRLIEALARRGQENAPDSNNDRERLQNLQNNYLNQQRAINANSPRTASQNRVGLRRSGDVEGVRQSSGNWHRDASFKYRARCYVKPIRYARLQQLKHIIYAAGHQEMEIYRREMRRRPVMINTHNPSVAVNIEVGRTRPRPNTRRGVPQTNPAYRTRSIRVLETITSEEEDEQEVESNSSNSSDSSANEEQMALDASSGSETESSEYSDWVADQPGPNLEPPQRSKRKPVERRAYSPSNDEPGPSTSNSQQAAGGTTSTRRKKLLIPTGGEIPEIYRPPEWLMEVIPRKAPYYPQMGDEVVFFRQGHQRYLEAVRSKKVYKLNNNCEPWDRIEMRDHVMAKVIGIKYEIRPPRLCCLKLAVMDADGNLNGNSFTIKYHDMPDVLDFLVLKQTFDTAMSRNWQPGNRFRCMIDDGWWMGQIETRTALSNEFPQSMFMCFHVRWDNGEYEYMSPWDMEPIDNARLPTDVGGAVSVLPEELKATLYQPGAEEWCRGDREAACRRIIVGLEQVMGLAIADPFLAPVDLNIYPAYAFVIEYPIDLSTIKARFENHFYRRITSAQFDVRYLATNAEKFNESHSNIVKHARIVTDLCLRIIRDYNDIDVGAVYHQLVDTYISSDTDDEHHNARPSAARKTSNVTTTRSMGSRRSQRLGGAFDWRRECRELLEMIWQCDDSSPFREPVDVIEHPDYSQIVDTPMDLLTIKEDLHGGNYNSPMEFINDIRLIFKNSKNYNTNKRSRIYSMTLRLSSLFEIHVRPIINNWKMAKRNKNKRTNSSNGVNERGGAPSTVTQLVDNHGRQQPGTSKRMTRAAATNGNGGTTSRRRFSSSDDDDDDDDETLGQAYRNSRATLAIAAQASSNGPPPSTTRNGRRIIGSDGIPGPSSSTNNGVSSSSSVMIIDAMPGPSSMHLRDPLEGGSNGSRMTRNRSENGRNEGSAGGVNGCRNDQKRTRPSRNTTKPPKSEHSSDSSSDSSDSDDDSNGIPLAELGIVGRRPVDRNYDSEDSYKPGGGGGASNRRSKKKKNGAGSGGTTSNHNNKRPSKRIKLSEDDDDDDDDDDSDHNDSRVVDPIDDDDEDYVVGRPSRSSRNASSRSRGSADQDNGAASSSRRENLRKRKSRRREDESDDVSSEDDDDDEFGRKSSSMRKRGRYESDQSFTVVAARPVRRTNRTAVASESDDEVSRPTRSSRRTIQRIDWSHHDDEDEPEEVEHNEDEDYGRRRTSSTRRVSNGRVAAVGASQRRSNRQRTRIHDSDDEEEGGHGSQPMNQSSQSSGAGSSRATVAPERSRRQQQPQQQPARESASNGVVGGRISLRRQLRNGIVDEDDDNDDDAEEMDHVENIEEVNVAEEEEDEEEQGDSEDEPDAEVDEDEEAENSDDQPLRRSRNNKLLNNRNRDCLRTRSGRRVHISGDDPQQTTTSHQHAGPSSSFGRGRLVAEVQVTTSTTAAEHLAPHEVDHNYGEMRQTRRTLSRHQRNADELDSLDPSSSSSSVAARMRPTSSAMIRRTYIPRQVVATTATAVTRSSNNNSSSIVSEMVDRAEEHQRQQQNNEDTDEDGGGESLSRLRSHLRSNHHMEMDGASSSRASGAPPPPPNQRASGRKTQRLYYNEDTDDEEANQGRAPRETRRTIRTQDEGNNHSLSANDDQDDNSDGEEQTDGDGEPSVSVSSRGRVRKIIAKARGLFKD